MSDITMERGEPWRIKLFGALEVVTPHDRAITVPGKKAGELLAYLALHPNRSHSREKLLDVIWADSEVGDTRTRLRQDILKLRSILTSSANDSSPLLVSKDSCQLAPGTTIDVGKFEEVLSLGKRETDPVRKCEQLRAAVGLYKGDLLPGFDAPWVAGERARLSHCFSQVLFELAEAERQLKDYLGCEKSLGMLLKHDPLSEECHIALMRLFAELGQPTRVQRQLQAMESALREGLDVSPTVGSLKLAEELREMAGQQAAQLGPKAAGNASGSAEPRGAFRDSAAAEQTHRPFITEFHPRPTPQNSHVMVALWAFRRPACLLVASVAIAAGLYRWREPRRGQIISSATTAPILERNREKWIYAYALGAGEMPNSEGRAIVADSSGTYVTGLIQTYKDDADILTLKLSHDGKLLWVDRYSSPEHDCDRAFSLCLDNKTGLFVAGQTYVPDRPGAPGGWHFTLLRYDRKGNKPLWVRRSPILVQHDGELIKVCSDGVDGCYICGTALESEKTHSALVMHYDRSGNVLWQRTVREGPDTEFHWCAVAPDGTLYICGKARVGNGASGVSDDWLTVSLDAAGKIQWHKLEDGPVHGTDSADRITVDRGGNVLVGGVFNTGDAGHGGHGKALGLVKYSPDGSKLWQRLAEDTGPNVCLNSLGVNFWGNSELGGMVQRDDGSRGIIFVRYDAAGNASQTWRYPMPAGYKTASACSSLLWGNESVLFMGQISRDLAMQEGSSLLFATCSPDGKLLNQFQFDDGPGHPTSVADFASNSEGIALTGQVGLKNGDHSLLVLQY